MRSTSSGIQRRHTWSRDIDEKEVKAQIQSSASCWSLTSSVSSSTCSCSSTTYCSWPWAQPPPSCSSRDQAPPRHLPLPGYPSPSAAHGRSHPHPVSFVVMAGKKKGAPGQGTVRSLPNASERARNRASPLAVVKLYDHLSIEQKGAIVDMDLESMLDIKCHSLHNPVINWLAPLYDKHTRVFVIPGRGRTPLNAESVYHTLALPHGDQNVRYVIDTDIENCIGPLLFPGHSSTPKITEVFTILKDMVDHGRVFKQMWMMYLTCTLLPPTTSNKLSSRVYPNSG